jgi:ribosomal-protein-alanine N-acetyltransferase
MLALEYAFCNMGLIRAEAYTQDLNISARKLLEKLGFTLEGRQRKARYWGGKYHDRLMYAILAEDYLNGSIQKIFGYSKNS